MTWKRSFLVVANVTATSDQLIEALKVRAEQEPVELHAGDPGHAVRRRTRGGA